MNALNLIAVNVGNTRLQVARFVDDALDVTERFENRRLTAAAQQVLAWWKDMAARPNAAVMIASVNDEAADRLAAMIEDQLSIETYRVGDDLPVPIGRRLDPETITGIDRLLNSAAAYDQLRQACVVVDAGTALTVDFVDGEGTFHGGAIAPGASMQLRALHEQTAGLPELRFRRPDDEAFGRSTSQAMLQGVYHGMRGTLQRLVERYAEHFGAFPQVVATGGDAEAIFGDDQLVDKVVPDLTVLGIAAAARHALAGDGVDGPDVRP